MKLPESILGAIFDLDGTLLDSMWIWEDIDKRFLSARGFAVPADYMKTLTTMDYRTAAEYTISRFGLNERAEDLMAEWSEMAVDAYATELKLKPAVKRYLLDLNDSGILLAVATSATRQMCVPALKNNGIYGLFKTVVTTMEVGKGKTFPDVYLAAAAGLGLRPCDCAVFEDSLRAVETAKSAGFVTVGVYDRYSESDFAAIRDIADMFVNFDE